jgi:hypothetical protein
VEDEDGEVVKTYELPKSKNQTQGESEPGPVRQGLSRMGTGLGLTSKQPAGESSKSGASSNPRQARKTGWGFGGKSLNSEAEGQQIEDDEEDDDRRIRFTIGGAGRRLTKEDFLKEIQSLDPKARSEVIDESDAPIAMKVAAKKDADKHSPGSSRLFGENGTGAKTVQLASGKDTAHAVGAEMARRKGARVEEGSSDEDSPHTSRPTPSSRRLAKSNSASDDEETAAERKRREKALRGVDDNPSPSRGRSKAEGSGPSHRGRQKSVEVETAAEKRRREAALGVNSSAQEDSDDDDTPRVPPPVAKPRGIRFAQSPTRDPKKA